MPTVAFNKFNAFVEHVNEGVHDFANDTLKLALTNVAPSASNSVLADITEISYTNLSSRTLTGVTSSQTGGTYTLDAANLALTSTGGSTGPFRYVVLYNDTPTSPADPLIGYYDYGSALTLGAGETLNFNLLTSIFTLT